MSAGAPHEAEQVFKAVLDSNYGSQGPSHTLRLSLSKALLAQSKADEASVLLEEVSREVSLSPRERAELSCMQAATEYLLQHETGRRYCEATDKALAAARAVGDRSEERRVGKECRSRWSPY